MNPVILYDSRFLDGIITATDTAPGFDVNNIKDFRPYTWWRANNSGTKYITVDCGVAKRANCFAVIGHNLATTFSTISVESSADNSTWTERLTGFQPANDTAFLKIFTYAEARYWRIKIISSYIVQLAVAMIGKRFDLPFPPDAPFLPYSQTVIADTSIGKTGNILGNLIRYKPITITATFSNIDRDVFYGTNQGIWPWGPSPWGAFPWEESDDITFMNFLIYASDLKPFFWAWDLTVYTDMVFFVTLDPSAAIELPVSILQYIDSITLTMKGVIEVK